MSIDRIKNISLRIKSFLNKSILNTDSIRGYLEPVMEMFKLNTSFLYTMAKIVEVKSEREDVISFTLKPGKRWKGFSAGQFVQLGMEINGSLHHRTFSISSGENLYTQKGLIRVSVQRQALGKVTSFMFESLKPKDYLRISKPMGSFTLESNKKEDVLFIAGGVGITPVLSMLSGVISSESQFTLMYYAGKEKSHLFMEELNFLAGSPNMTIHFIDTDNQGFMSAQHLVDFCPNYKNRKIYLCGPQAMDSHVRTVLGKEEFDEVNIIAESFTAPSYTAKDKEFKEINIFLAKVRQQYNVLNSKTILELLESQKFQPKYGCRKGICNQCSCKKSSGLVYNLLTKKLSDSGEEFIKICSTIPVGDLVLDL